MSGLVNALVILAVAVVVIARQFGARRVSADRRWWLLPVVLGAMALSSPGLIDVHHRARSVFLLAAALLIAMATGAGWAWTTRIWVETDGRVWSRSTQASGAVWAVGVALRVGLIALGTTLGIHQDSHALLLGLACTLLVRSAILVARAQSLTPVTGPVPAYGDGMIRRADKERV
ncbi:DUF1453 domain-containing protein [Streptomyces sp. Ru71]|uniref:DUF1453 domain-containing protein n=1 Tax=Streptomyces sp. Ru71 TaxID=2080746 RepID=UPI000CDCF921|nr:DUF1453 domain-containing protein [Streptomyces sp. Ru71]POX50680.1 DUF1453 domain-containing protein [Streptomyces sp. Ru71]